MFGILLGFVCLFLFFVILAFVCFDFGFVNFFKKREIKYEYNVWWLVMRGGSERS